MTSKIEVEIVGPPEMIDSFAADISGEAICVSNERDLSQDEVRSLSDPQVLRLGGHEVALKAIILGITSEVGKALLREAIARIIKWFSDRGTKLPNPETSHNYSFIFTMPDGVSVLVNSNDPRSIELLSQVFSEQL